MAFFRAAQVVVVVPEECQSKPSMQENDWNQNGSDSLSELPPAFAGGFLLQ